MMLSICVVNYQSEKDLEGFLQSFSEFRPDFLFEMIIVNNGSKYLNLEAGLIEKFGNWIRVIEPGKNVGFGAAQNLAVKEAKGEYVFLCNPDLRLRDLSLQKLVYFAGSNPEFGVIGPMLVYPDGEIQKSCRRFPSVADLLVKRLGFRSKAEQYLMGDVDLRQPIEVDWLVGAAMLLRRDRFLEVGGFDERFFLFFEDTDLCRRIKQKGYSVRYHPEFSFIHNRLRLSESSFPGMWVFKKTFWIHLISAMRYFGKWKGEGS